MPSTPPKPKITSPLDRVPIVNAFSFKMYADHPDPGVNYNAYRLYRQALSPTAGLVETWNATTSTWSTTLTTNTVTPFAPLSTLTVGGIGFTSGTRYKIQVSFNDTNSQASPQSDPIIIMPMPTGTCTITQPAANFTASRPRVAWNFVSSGAGKQVFWRVIVYEDNTSTIFWDSGYRYDPDKMSCVIEADCRTGHNYYFQMSIYDENNLSIGSAIAGPYLCTLNLPAAPSVAFTTDPAGGTMLVEVTSAFNLLSVDTADLLTVGGIGGWTDVKNANATYDPTIANIGTASLRITAAGKSYGYLDTESGTFGNEDTLYGTYNDEINSMEP